MRLFCTTIFNHLNIQIMPQTVVNSLFDYIIDNGIATDSEVRLVVDINGYSEETMKDIIFARTGNRSYEQCVADGFSRDSYLDSYYELD